MELGVINHESIIIAPALANQLLLKPTLCCGDGAGSWRLSVCVRVRIHNILLINLFTIHMHDGYYTFSNAPHIV